METPVVFECKGQQLIGMLHLPQGRGCVPAALLLHGFNGNKCEVHRMFVKLSRQLADHGIASLRFDFRGAGDSSGDCQDMTIRSQIADAVEAVRWLGRHKRVNARRVAVIGLSMGGAIAAHLAAREKARVKTLVLLAPVADGSGILDALATPEAVASVAQTGITDYVGNLVGVQFIRQFAEMKPVREVVRGGQPVLLVHGENDETVPVEHSAMYEKALLAAKRTVKRVVLPGANHSFSRHVWEERVLIETLDWLGETL